MIVGQSRKKKRFTSAILPRTLRKAIDELIPWLYLKDVSTGDFTEVLQALMGAEWLQNERQRLVQGMPSNGVQVGRIGAKALATI